MEKSNSTRLAFDEMDSSSLDRCNHPFTPELSVPSSPSSKCLDMIGVAPSRPLHPRGLWGGLSIRVPPGHALWPYWVGCLGKIEMTSQMSDPRDPPRPAVRERVGEGSQSASARTHAGERIAPMPALTHIPAHSPPLDATQRERSPPDTTGPRDEDWKEPGFRLARSSSRFVVQDQKRSVKKKEG